MKKLLLGRVALIALAAAGPAVAADLPAQPAYKAPIVAPVIYTWTGCYVGAEGGGTWGRARTDVSTGFRGTNDFNVSGGLAGGTVGCNWQVASNWVFGLEGDLSWTNKRGSANEIPPFAVLAVNTVKERWLGTGRARLGYVVAPQWLIYATGGFAVADVQATVDATALGGPVASSAQTRWGFAAGAGTEWMFAPNWSAKLEYLFVGLQNSQYTWPGTGFIPSNFPLYNHVVRVGVNWHFNWDAPVRASY